MTEIGQNVSKTKKSGDLAKKFNQCDSVSFFSEGNQNKNNCLVSNIYNKLKSPAPFYLRTVKSAGNFNLL